MAEIELSLAALRNSIVDRLKANTVPGGGGKLMGTTIFKGQVIDGKRVPTDTLGDMTPYACVVFGVPGRSAARNQGIVGNRKDLRRFTFGVELYALTDDELENMQDRVIDILQGFEPVNGGEIDVITSGEIANPAELKQNHTRIGRGLIFECLSNTITSVDAVE